jgi:6,7-dimethyl-8-ribityllumazine synthase
VTTYEGHLDGTSLRFAVVASRFNDFVVSRLVEGARDALVRHGVAAEDVDVAWVPGAWELPVVAHALAASGRYHGVVALGAVIRGSTYHFEVVAGHSAAGLTKVALDTGVPVGNGVLTVESIEQAIERAGSKAGNKGAEAAVSTLETANLLRALAG